MAKDDQGHGSEPLSAVEKHWDKLGISHRLSQSRGMIEVGKIVVPKEKRGEGLGTEAMERLTQHADENGLRIGLTPDSSFGGSKPRLKEFYGRFGFKENKGRSRDLSVTHGMIREPAVRAESGSQIRSTTRNEKYA